jgi:malonate transporter and related proteins
MTLTALTVLLPVFFVLGLGYFAGRAKKFDADQIAGLNDLVLDYAFPAMMFVATVKTPRDELLSEGSYALALLVAFVGLFLAVVLVSTQLLRHSLGEATLQANLASFPSVGFFGPPIFQGLFGPSSLVSIAFASTLSAVTMIPLTLVLLEIHHQRTTRGEGQRVSSLIVQSLANTLKKPMVWAPLIGVALVLAGARVPPLIDNMLMLIGSSTSGASIFLAGLIIAAYEIRLNGEVIANALVKMVAQPLLMVLLVAALKVGSPLAGEGIVICAIPTAVFAPLLAPRYRIYEVESSSTLLATALLMIVTLPIAIFACRSLGW